MLPMLNRVVHFFPMWVAPNLITLSGLLFMTGAYVLLCGVYASDLRTQAPAWVYLFCAFAKFMYQVLDELDGKQARRTGSSSPMGELFDHGCDALSCVLTTTTIAAAMQLGPGWAYWALNVSVFGTFYSTIWEQLHTNFLELHYLGPNEAHASYIALMLATCFAGPAFWAAPVPLVPFVISFRHAAVSLLLLGTLIDLAINFARVRPLMKSTSALIRGVYLLVPFPLTVLLSYVWIRVEPSVMYAHPQALALGLGFMNSHLVGTLILSRVTTDEPNPYAPSLWLLTLLVLTYVLNPSLAAPYTHLAVHAYAWFAALNWAHFALSTIYQLCDILKVKVLRIPVKPAPPTTSTPSH